MFLRLLHSLPEDLHSQSKVMSVNGLPAPQTLVLESEQMFGLTIRTSYLFHGSYGVLVLGVPKASHCPWSGFTGLGPSLRYDIELYLCSARFGFGVGRLRFGFQRA